MSSREELLFRADGQLVYPIAESARAVAMWNFIRDNLRTNHISITRTGEVTLCRMFNFDNTARTKEERKRIDGTTNTRDDSIGGRGIDFLIIEVQAVTLQQPGTRNEMNAFWTLLVADLALYTEFKAPNRRALHTDINIHVCGHDFVRFRRCQIFKHIIKNRVIVDEVLP